MTTAEAARLSYAQMAVDLRTMAREKDAAGKPATARRYRQRADVAMRAAAAELVNPPPQDPPWCLCQTCQAHLFDVHWRKLT